MITVGLDLGSVTTKAVLVEGNSWISLIRPTGYSPRQAGREAFEELLGNAGLKRGDIGFIVGTGYGRISVPFIDQAVTEITCHAKGAHFLVKEIDMVIDIGGQDSKVIAVDRFGNVTDFAMNDRCAAGTGKFLEVIAAALGLDVSELAMLSKTPIQSRLVICVLYLSSRK